MSKSPDVDTLVEDLCKTGCKVSWIRDPKALEFIEKVMIEKRAGKNPCIQRASDLLMEVWGIEIKRRSLSAHIRGECGCPKKTTK